MLLQSLTAAFTLSGSAGLLVLAITSDTYLAGRVAMLLASVSFLISGIVNHRLAWRERTARIDRLAWRVNPLVDQPAAIAPPLPPAAPDRDIRLIPVRHGSTTFASDAPAVLLDSADSRDIRAFIDGLAERGHSRSAWIGTLLPSGRRCTTEYYELLIGPLVKAGAIRGRRPRVAGELVLSAAAIRQRLGLA